MIARRIPKRWRYKIRRIYLHPGELIVGIFGGQSILFFMATSLLSLTIRNTNREFLPRLSMLQCLRIK